MATDDISVSISIQGESKFQKALKECQNTVKQLDSALKANAAEYEANADALGENAERTKLLKQSIETQKKMVEGLGEAIKYATEQYGEASAQTTKYVVAQNKAKEAVAKLEKELKDADREMEEVGRDSIRVGRQLESGIGDGAEDATRKLGEMMDDIKSELEGIGQSVGITATIDVVKNTMDDINNLTEETKEYRRQVSYLEQNTKDAGQAWADIEGHLFRVTANTGSLEDATEGISNLLAAGFDSEEIADSVNLLLGAVTKFPQTYKFEGLAESLRNTVEEGKAVGQYSELLLALGVNLEVFNEAMSKATDKEHRQDLALSFGANRGLEKTIAEYERANKLMLEANTAMIQYKADLSVLAEETTPIGTAWTDMASAAIKAVTSLLENTQVDEWIVNVLNGITELITYIDDYLNEDGEWKQEVIAETEMKVIDDEIRRLETLIREAEEAGNQFMKNKYTGELEDYKEMRKALEEALKESGISVDMTESGEMAGESVVSGMTTAIEDETPALISAAAAAVDGINAEFERVTVPDVAAAWESQMNRLQAAPVPIGGGRIRSNVREVSSTDGVTVNFNVGGTRFWSAHIDDINAVQGRTIQLG